MAAGAVIADQHAGAERVARRGERLLLGEGGRRQHLALEPVRRLPGRSPRLKQTSSLSSLRLAKKACHSGPTESGACS